MSFAGSDRYRKFYEENDPDPDAADMAGILNEFVTKLYLHIQVFVQDTPTLQTLSTVHETMRETVRAMDPRSESEHRANVVRHIGEEGAQLAFMECKIILLHLEALLTLKRTIQDGMVRHNQEMAKIAKEPEGEASEEDDGGIDVGVVSLDADDGDGSRTR